MDQTAITYPQTTLNELTGAQIKAILEDVADNLFNPDPYLQPGRRHGARRRHDATRCSPGPRSARGSRDLRLKDQPAGGNKALQSGRMGAGRRRCNG